jgi:hypothetical protein
MNSNPNYFKTMTKSLLSSKAKTHLKICSELMNNDTNWIPLAHGF